jgi:hypothetical protein
MNRLDTPFDVHENKRPIFPESRQNRVFHSPKAKVNFSVVRLNPLAALEAFGI